ncbi:MAG TPA: hypothetical protein V6D10_14940 [Trichocoleus sp.]|jgi:hypothetical protein
MREAPVAPESKRGRIHRKDLVSSLVTGMVIGGLAWVPIGWFAHRVYHQQRTAQIILCRQQHFGTTEAELNQTCGSLY